jgi:hypothetical protein
VAKAPAQTKDKAIVEMERLGYAFTEDAQYDLSNLDPTKRVQVREDGHYAPKDAVERYAIQMAHSQFPPIIVTSDGWIVDGNTRVGASLSRGSKFFPAYVLDVAWNDLGDDKRDLLFALAATLNSQNGTALTREESRVVVERLLDLGWNADNIARAIGVKGQVISAVKREIAAEDKLARVGLTNENGSAIKGASLRALGGKDVVTLNDQPFKSLATLAVDAGLNAKEIGEAAKSAKDTGSDSLAIETLEKLRAEMDDRIRDKALTGHGNPPASRMLRQHLGFVVNREPGALVETNPTIAVEHTALIRTAIERLNAVLAAQEAR